MGEELSSAGVESVWDCEREAGVAFMKRWCALSAKTLVPNEDSAISPW